MAEESLENKILAEVNKLCKSATESNLTCITSIQIHINTSKDNRQKSGKLNFAKDNNSFTHVKDGQM